MKDFGLDADDSLDETCGIVYSTKRGKIVFNCALCEEAYSSCEDFLLHLSEVHLTAKALKQSPLVTETSDTDGSNEMSKEIDYLDCKWEQSDPLILNSPHIDCCKQEELDKCADFEEYPDSYSSHTTSLNSLGEVIQQERNDDSEASHNQVDTNEEYPIEKHAGDDEPHITIEINEQKSKGAKKTTKLQRSCAERPRKYRKLDLEIQGQPIKCLTCPGIFANIEDFRNHLKDHVNYICTKCSGGFLTKRTFDLHMDGSKTDTDCALLTRPYKCKYCDFGFRKKARMTVHMRLHFDDSNFHCSKCPKSFQTKYRLKVHMNTHIEEKAFKCHICGVTMSNHANMISHISRHSEENRKFECEHCQKKFFTRTELGMHTRAIHTKERPYLCPDCGISFPIFTQLTLHQTKRHTVREKNLKCELCSQLFFDRRNLRRHLLTHSNERNHVCSVCCSTFKTAKTLKTHLKIHENKRLYKCDLCQKGFNQKPALTSHLKSVHNKNM